ncbi:MAG: hypothetical protein WBC44_01245 [Planctomycetaceae bacterium]
MTAPSHRPIDYAHHFPWTRLFRALRIATDPRKLILAALALTALWGGEQLLSMLPFAPAEAQHVLPPWDAVSPIMLVGDGEEASWFFDLPREHSHTLAARVLTPVRPLLDVLGLTFGSAQSWPTIAWVWTRLFWSLAVWSLFGGAIARLAAVEFARDERIGLGQAFRFSAARFPSLFAAPLLPIAAILGLWGINALGGLLGRIPLVGDWVVAIAWGIAVVVALLIVLITIATAIGWPLMVAAVATENSDAFDGFSRSFSFVYSRPWLGLWYVAAALLLGIACAALVDTLAVGVVSAAARTVASGMGERSVAGLQIATPGYFTDVSAAMPDTDVVGFPGMLMAVWLSAIAMVAIGFAASYFWTATTIVYFLLRRADDATHFDEVWLGETDEEDDLLPLAGIASTDQPVTERSHHPTVDPPITTA